MIVAFKAQLGLRTRSTYLSFNLNFLDGVMGWSIIGAIKGDASSFDFGSDGNADEEPMDQNMEGRQASKSGRLNLTLKVLRARSS